MKISDDKINLIGGIAIGLFSSLFINLLYYWMQDLSTNQRVIAMLILIVLIILTVTIMNKASANAKLREKFQRHKERFPNQSIYTGKKIIITNIPNYIQNIGNYFSADEIKKLNKNGYFGATYQNILRDNNWLE